MNLQTVLSLTLSLIHPGSVTTAHQAAYAKASGWSVTTDGPGIPGGQNAEAFAIGKDTIVRHQGRASGVIRATSTNEEAWRAFSQAIRANAYRGKRVRLRGYLKTKAVSGASGLWMRVDAIDRQAEFDNMGDRPVRGTTDWKQYSVVLDVPKDAAAIFLGDLQVGTGTTWMDDLSLEIVDPSQVATTGTWLGPNTKNDPVKPQNLDFTAGPAAGKPDIPGWKNNTGGWSEDIHLDPQMRRNGKATATLRSVKSGNVDLALFQEIRGEQYRGKRVEFRATIQTTGKVAGGVMLAIPGGGQWAVANVPQFIEKGTEWVRDTRDWKPVSAVLDVPAWARCIQFGVQLNSYGQMWISESTFKVVDPKTTPVTYCSPMPTLYTDSDLKAMPKAPVNMDFEK
jgi:hypothetical protein